ncbi:MAG: Crp/Fnr family transcriptional regulator [Acidobacteria bacterium]|nr:MAG: Crp/Fnr family transcriptional regulator [Acidobacteriota bacterium]
MTSNEHRKLILNCQDCRKRKPSSFCDLPEPVFAELSGLMIHRSYQRGSTIFIEGQPSKGVYLLCSGRAKLLTYSEEGKAIILRIADAGEVLGLGAVIAGTPYEKAAHAIDECTVGFVKRKEFIRFLETHHVAALNALRQMSANYQKAHTQICSLGLSATVGDKLARLLLQWYDRSTIAGPARFLQPHTHGEIAEMIATTRETVTRLLKDFRDRGLITLEKGELCIPERMKLKAAIGSKHGNGNGHV